ncbi:hypothetical protein M0R45_025231 [Rubus argutus]|uniref:Uncharacterized protein n=1 Tax=Rubus argutus TaxID=59490 RepID=A0AAW1WUV8_RUBAR
MKKGGGRRSSRRSSAAALLETPPQVAFPPPPNQSPPKSTILSNSNKRTKKMTAVRASSIIGSPSLAASKPLADANGLASIPDLKNLASSRLQDLKLHIDRSHTEILKDCDSAHSRLHKRFKIQTQACQQMLDEADKEFKKMTQRTTESREAMMDSKQTAKELAAWEADLKRREKIVVPNPDLRGRQEILELYLQDKPLADDVDAKVIARGTAGFNGADLANLVNIAAIKAAVDGAEKLTGTQLEFAKDRIIMGTERKTMFLSEESKKLTAYHESGHAIVAFNTEGAHPIHKATIMPRGSALGMVTQLPSNDETSVSKKQLLARLDVCMGGRVAEEIIFGQDHVTTGASSDLSTATQLAHYMVSSCGMSETIGPVHIKERPSSEMQSRIDAEVVKMLREAYDRVRSLLRKHEKALHALANALLEYETLNSEEVKRILLPYQEGRLPEQQEEQQEEGDLVLA